MSQTAFRERSKIPVLTGVRMLAALLVYLSHQTNLFLVSGPLGLIGHFFAELGIGVTFFFVLSGFVIAYRYYDAARVSPSWLATYARNRFARIYPVYFLLTLLSLLSFYLGHSQAPEPFAVVLNFTLTKGLFRAYRYTGIAQGWSLTVEEMFYISAPIIFFAIGRGYAWVPFVLIPLTGIALTSLGLGFHTFLDNFPFLAVYTFFGRFFEFFCGIALALWFMRRETKEPGSGRPVLTFFGCWGVLATVVALALMQADPSVAGQIELSLKQGTASWAGILVSNCVLPILITVLYAGLLLEQSILRRVLSTRAFILLGESSYVFYLIQQGDISRFVLDHVCENRFGHFTVIMLIAIAIHKLIEAPCNRLLRKRIPGVVVEGGSVPLFR